MSQGADANKVWQASHGYQKGKIPGWFVYLLYGVLLIVFLILWPKIQSEVCSPHPERPVANPKDWLP